MPKVVLTAIALVFGILFLWAIKPFYHVESYERAVVTRFGEFRSVEGEGLHFLVPFVNSVTYYRTDIRSLAPKEAVNTYTIDNQEVNIIFTVFYQLPPERIEYVYRNVQDYQERLFSLVIDRLKSEMGRVNVSQVASKRGEIRDRIQTILETDVQELGLKVTDFQLTNIDYTKSFRAAVEQAAAAKAMVETREQELNQARKTAERAKVEAEGKANAIREEARGQSDANLLVAEAEAKAIKLKGEAEAAAIEAQARALGANPHLVDLRKAERWNGALPTSMLSNVVPFMNVDQNVQTTK